jgi:hypothetical protein
LFLLRHKSKLFIVRFAAFMLRLCCETQLPGGRIVRNAAKMLRFMLRFCCVFAAFLLRFLLKTQQKRCETQQKCSKKCCATILNAAEMGLVVHQPKSRQNRYPHHNG